MKTNDIAKVTIKHNPKWEESYNSAYRIFVDKPVGEKYARKLCQDFLKSNTSMQGGWTVNKLWEHSNGLCSEQPDGWVFGLSNQFAFIFGNYDDLLRRISEND